MVISGLRLLQRSVYHVVIYRHTKFAFQHINALLGVFQALLDNGATVIVIEHDLDVIRNADYVIDMGPGGGDAGGRIVASGTPQEIRENQASITGRYL